MIIVSRVHNILDNKILNIQINVKFLTKKHLTKIIIIIITYAFVVMNE